MTKTLQYEAGLQALLSIALVRSREGPPIAAMGIAGGSGSGKTYCCAELAEIIGSSNVPTVILKMDRYYLTKDELTDAGLAIDFDTPESVRLSDLASDIFRLKAGACIDEVAYEYLPSSDGFPTAIRKIVGEITPPTWGIILVEGLYVHRPPVRNMLDHVTYIHQPDTTRRMQSRIERDVATRGYSQEVAFTRWSQCVEPGFETYIQPDEAMFDHLDLVIENRY